MRRSTLRFHLVDVFAIEPLTGNPLAVVENRAGGTGDDDGGSQIDEEVMRRLAREFNQSETTFVLPPVLPGADWRLRSFTAAGVEVNGAGHNAMGAWWWLAAAGQLPAREAGKPYWQEIGGEVLRVDVIRDTGGGLSSIVMQQGPLVVRQTALDRGALAHALGLSEDAFAEDLSPVAASTGTAHLHVALRDASVLDRVVPRQDELKALLAAANAEGCYVFALTPTSTVDIHARFFNPTVGLWEDPATGTAAGPLSAWLVALGRLPGDRHVRIEQGRAAGRPSVIEVEVRPAGPAIHGRCIVVASGDLWV